MDGCQVMADLGEQERTLYRISRANMLLVGPASRVDAVIAAVTGLPAESIPAWSVDDSDTGNWYVPETLLVRDVHLLSSVQQAHLFQAIGMWQGRVRVIATAPAPLYPLVERQHFHEGLYYRLNMLCLSPGSGGGLGDAHP